MTHQRPMPLSHEDLRLISQGEESTDTIVRDISAAFKKEVAAIMGSETRTTSSNTKRTASADRSKSPGKGAERKHP